MKERQGNIFLGVVPVIFIFWDPRYYSHRLDQNQVVTKAIASYFSIFTASSCPLSDGLIDTSRNVYGL